MLTGKDVIKDGHETLRKRAAVVPMPPSEEDQQLLDDMIDFVMNSQDDEFAKKHNVRPGIGLAAPQIGVSKRAIAIFIEGETVEDNLCLTLFNPRIVSHSSEMTYIEAGEGCLSVDENYEGIVPRYAKITVKADDYDGDPFEETFTGLDAICLQHEIDHLNGILFYDHINKENPFAKIENGQPLV